MRALIIVVSVFSVSAWVVHAQVPASIVVTPVSDKLKAVGLKIQAAEKIISSSSRIILSGMSGDVTSSLEVLTEQNGILKDNEELRSSLGNVLKVSQSVKGFERRIQVSMDTYKAVEDNIKSFGPMSLNTFKEVNRSLRDIRRLLDEAEELQKASMDMKDKISRIVRLEKMQESRGKTDNATDRMEELRAWLNSLLNKKLKQKRRFKNFVISSIAAETVGNKNNIDIAAETVGNKNNIEAVERGRLGIGFMTKELTKVNAKEKQTTYYKDLLEKVLDYADYIVILTVVIASFQVFMVSGVDKLMDKMKLLFSLFIIYSLFRIIILQII